MGSLRLAGVWFQVFADDHCPPHVHARYGDIRCVIEVLDGDVCRVRLREGSLEPGNAKRADIRHALAVAQQNAAELLSLWRVLHD